jgi:hypothetical protein
MKENKFIATKYDKEWEKETLKFDYHGEKGLDQKPPFLSCVFIKKGGVYMIMDLQEHISLWNLHIYSCENERLNLINC